MLHSDAKVYSGAKLWRNKGKRPSCHYFPKAMNLCVRNNEYLINNARYNTIKRNFSGKADKVQQFRLKTFFEVLFLTRPRLNENIIAALPTLTEMP